MSTGSILAVDDDLQIRRVIRTTLAAQGYDASEARTGEEALDKVRTKDYDLILLDMNMAGLGGLETCRRIRGLSDAAIIMLTVRNTEKDKVEALDAGADDYVTKPFSTPELLARIRAALRRLPFTSGNGLHLILLEDREINLATRRIKSGDKEVRFTPKEFELMRYFVDHANIPASHAELLRAVWGPEYGEEVEYLRVFVNQLRKKIEKDPSQPRYLLTEPWVGYRFSPPDQV